MSRVADPFLEQARALLAEDSDPFLAQARALLGTSATPDVAKATPNVALPPVPGNLNTLGGAIGYVGDVTRAVRPEQGRGVLADIGVGLMQGIPVAAQQVGGALPILGS